LNSAIDQIIVKSATVLDVKINALNLPLTLAQIKLWITKHESNYICVSPAHSIMEVHDDRSLLPIFNQSGLTTPDGMAIVWIMRLKGFKEVDRVYGPDLLLATCEFGIKEGWKHFFYGGAPGVVNDLTTNLSLRFPGLQIVGTYTPPFRPLTAEEDEEVSTIINQSHADIVWVGISTPKQERWMSSHNGKVIPPVLIGIGAAFDFIAGRKHQAPHWIQRSGFEWLYRLWTEPKRLWPRYRKYPRFVFLVIVELLSGLVKSKRYNNK
jgi:N-acetylglucosaminyldiphosphoundecaprenol N-acetyl-beta-D-mannosaminyltransferase